MARFPYNPFNSSLNFGKEFIKWFNKTINDIGLDLQENKNRVDNLINSTPQPSEVVDMRVDSEGVAHSTANDRLVSDYNKLDNKFGDIGQLGEYTDIIDAVMKIGADVKYFGAKGDGVTNDTVALKAAIAFADTYKCKLILSAGEYLYTEDLKFPSGMVVEGVGKYKSILKPKGAIKAVDLSDDSAKVGLDFSRFAIEGDNTVGQVGLDLNYVTNASNLHDIRIQYVDVGVRMTKTWYHAISRLYIRNCLTYGLHVKSLSPTQQVNAAKFQHLFIQECLHNVFLDGSQNVSAAAGFDACTFEKSRKTAVIANGFSPLTFSNTVYFEANYTDALTETLTWQTPIDLKVSGTDVRNIVELNGAYFARRNDFAPSTQKTSVFVDNNIKLLVSSTQFVCNTGDYIDANIYSISKYPAKIINVSQDGFAKKFYIGKQKEDVVIFQKEYNLKTSTGLDASGVVTEDGDYYIRFLAHQTGSVDKAVPISVRGLVSNEQFGTVATLPTLFSGNATVELPLGYISGTKVVKLQASLETTTDLKGTIYLVRKHND